MRAAKAVVQAAAAAATTKSQPHRLHRSLIEVERKFKFDARTHDQFRTNIGMPRFRALQALGRSSFEDVYFDRDDILSSRGVWVRKRGEKWEAKVCTRPRTGNAEMETMPLFVNSQVEEISDVAEIARVVQDAFLRNLNSHDTTTSTCIESGAPLSLSASTCFGLSPMARFTTFREAWKVDGRFNVVFDSTDFGHAVGEVELEVELEMDVEMDGNKKEISAKRRVLAMEADSEIEEFMARYSWAFPAGKPVGKLSAYFAQRGRNEKL